MANTKGYKFYSISDNAPSGAEQKFEIIGDSKSHDTSANFIEWKQVILKFNRYNRNRRKWTAQHVRQSMLHSWIQDYFVKYGGVPGENGHPTSSVKGESISMERIVTIDPNNISLLLKKYEFEGDEYLWGTFQTIDDGNGPGDKLRRSIIQGMVPSVSLRSIVPQRKNPDGTIDVVGPGRIICWDRVFYPSDDEAFGSSGSFKLKSNSINPVVAKESTNDSDFNDVADYVLTQSEVCKYVLDGMDVATESSSVSKDGLYITTTDNGPIFIPIEERIKNDIEAYMRRL